MTLSENALYTVDGWRVFFEHLKPGRLITFSCWYLGRGGHRDVSDLFPWPGRRHSPKESRIPVTTSLWFAQAISPFSYPAIVRCHTLDLHQLRRIAKEKELKFLWLPGEPTRSSTCRPIARARSVCDLFLLRGQNVIDYSPHLMLRPTPRHRAPWGASQ